MYESILVPLDGSEMGRHVLPYVSSLAKNLNAAIKLLRVIEPIPPDLEAMAQGLSPEQIASTRSGHGRDGLEGVAAFLREDGLHASCVVYEGDPSSHIVSEGEKDPNTLIAMTTHGRQGLARWVLGSVTDRVLHATSNPLLIIRAREPDAAPRDVKLSNVIVPLDGSALAEQVLTHVTPMAKALRLNVILVRVTPSAEEYHQYMEAHPISSAATIYMGPYEEFSKEADARAMEYLHGIKDMLHQHGVLSVEEKLLRGRASSALVDIARNTPDNLVAMTTHGRSGVGRWLLGSVTGHMVRQSDDPVLVIRAKA